MAKLIRKASRLPFAPVVAVMFGVAGAALALAMPSALFDHIVGASGLPHLLPAARAPFGLTAHLLAALAAFIVVAAIVAAIATPLGRRFDHGAKSTDPVVETEDVPAAPLRKRGPIIAAAELGAPLMSDEAVLAGLSPQLRDDWSPLDAMPPEPAAPEPERSYGDADWSAEPSSVANAPEAIADEPVAVEPVAQVESRADEPDAPQDVSDTPADAPAVVQDDSIAGLIRRLEDGIARRSTGGDPDGEPAAPLPSWVASTDAAPLARNADDDASDTTERALRALRRLAS